MPGVSQKVYPILTENMKKMAGDQDFLSTKLNLFTFNLYDLKPLKGNWH